MKRSFLTFAAITLMFSAISCKETTTVESTEDVQIEIFEAEAPEAEVSSEEIETSVEESQDTTEEAVEVQ